LGFGPLCSPLVFETTLRLEPEKRMDIDSDQLKSALKKLDDAAKRLNK